MVEPRYPNESPAYRQARDALLEAEKALIAQVKAELTTTTTSAGRIWIRSES